MIFVTVGSQMPFDRLIQAMDQWAAAHPGHPVSAQIGQSSLVPRYLQSVAALPPEGFRQQVQAARVIVAHAGMGSVLTAIEYGKPLVLMPRRGDLRETRNDHQVATARWLADKPGIEIANDATELADAIGRALATDEPLGATDSGPREALRGYLAGVLREAVAR